MATEYCVQIDGTTYQMDELFSVSITQPLFERLSVGNACSAELTVTFVPRGNVAKMAKIIPFSRCDSSEQWCQLGVFYTDTRKLSKGILSLTACDAMLRAEVIWEPDQSLVFPMTMPQAVAAIAREMDIDIDPRTALNDEYTIDYPANEYTMRDVLRYIAGAHGGNWVITAQGSLLLVPLFKSMPQETNHLVTETGRIILLGGCAIGI